MCPTCRTPFTNGGTWKLPMISFKTIKQKLEKTFSFFPKLQANKLIMYNCPKCGLTHASDQEIGLTRVPDKTGVNPLTGETIVKNWKLLPSCRRCKSFLIRRKL